MSSFSVLKEMIKRFQGKRAILYFGEILLMGITMGALNVVFSKMIGDLSNAAIYNQNIKDIAMGRYLLALLVVILINNFLGVCYNNEAKRTANTISNSVFAKAFYLPIDFYDSHHSGDYMSKLIYDCEMASGVFGSRLRRLIMPVVIVCVCVVPMFIMCPPVMAGLFTISLLSLFLDVGMIPLLKKFSVKISNCNKELTKSITNMLQGMETIRMYPLKDAVSKTYDKANETCADSMLKQGNMEAVVSGIRSAFDLIGSLVFLALGLVYMDKTGGKVGNLVSLYLLYGTFQYHFLQIGVYIPSLASFLVNGERVLTFLDSREEQSARKDTAAFTGHDSDEISLEVRNITFGYEGSDSAVFENFSLSVTKGSYAITGESGRGKSTLAKLILGFYPLASGDILINGIAASQCGVEQMRKQIAYIPQEPYLFHMSIRENIRLGKTDATEEEIVNAAKAAYAHDFIMKLEHGYDTVLGERGNTVSGGQRQRIAIARAVIRNAPVIIMDEATSALDNESEKCILNVIDRLKENAIVLMIAHRPSTIEIADQVIEI